MAVLGSELVQRIDPLQQTGFAFELLALFADPRADRRGDAVTVRRRRAFACGRKFLVLSVQDIDSPLGVVTFCREPRHVGSKSARDGTDAPVTRGVQRLLT